MPSIRLILVSHAASTATRRGAFATGAEPLEPAAISAAHELRVALPVMGSSLVSPAATARLTAEALGLEPEVSLMLRDLDAGCWTGRSITDIAPLEAAAWLADPLYAGHGGESLAAMIERTAGFLSARLKERGTTIAVTHAALLRAALVSVLAAPASAFWCIDVPPLATLALVSDGRRWALRAFGPMSKQGESGNF